MSTVQFGLQYVSIHLLYYSKNLNNLELIEIVSTNELSTFSYFIKYNSIWSILRSLPQNYISQGGALSFLFYIKQIKLKKLKEAILGNLTPNLAVKKYAIYSSLKSLHNLRSLTNPYTINKLGWKNNCTVAASGKKGHVTSLMIWSCD